MYLPIYVVSMDESRLSRTKRELYPRKVTHIPGVNGAEERESPNITFGCRHFCTDRIIGCALGHQNAALHFLNSTHSVALILEDDVKLIANDLEGSIQEILKEEWDICKLFCQGICSNKIRTWQGSTAAYLIRRSGARKLAKMKISYHIDYILSSMLFDVKLGPELFSTFDDRTGVLIGNQDVRFWLNQELIRIAGLDLKARHVLPCLILTLVAFKLFEVELHMYTLIVAFMITFIFFYSYETQYYNCTTETHGFGIVLPLFVIFAWKASTPIHHVTVGLAQAMFVFHSLYELERT